MNVKYQLVKLIVKLYFFGALAVSFTHVIEAAHKLELSGWQTWTTPFAIDEIAAIGMVMRGAAFSRATRQLGFRVQVYSRLDFRPANERNACCKPDFPTNALAVAL